jgi:hypothetical protein
MVYTTIQLLSSSPSNLKKISNNGEDGSSAHMFLGEKHSLIVLEKKKKKKRCVG